MFLNILDYFLISLAGVVVIVNPITSAFIFVSLLPDSSMYERRLTAMRASVISAIIMITFILTGKFIFQLFGITIGAFRIAGGLILFGIAMGMMKKSEGEHDHHAHPKVDDINDIAIIPLAIPFMSGPGSIATVTLLSTEASSVFETMAVILAVIIVCAACYYSMFYSEQLVKFVGDTGKKIITKLFGLILAVISVQFVINGVLDVLPRVVEVISAL